MGHLHQVVNAAARWRIKALTFGTAVMHLLLFITVVQHAAIFLPELHNLSMVLKM